MRRSSKVVCFRARKAQAARDGSTGITHLRGVVLDGAVERSLNVAAAPVPTALTPLRLQGAWGMRDIRGVVNDAYTGRGARKHRRADAVALR
jgi:hypothetical protein